MPAESVAPACGSVTNAPDFGIRVPEPACPSIPEAGFRAWDAPDFFRFVNMIVTERDMHYS
jgi:hypothetical protein